MECGDSKIAKIVVITGPKIEKKLDTRGDK